MDGPVLRCGIGTVPCGNRTIESKTTLAVCKVLVPAIVSKCRLMMWGPHAVIIPVSQDILAVQSNMMSVFCGLIFVTWNFIIAAAVLLRQYFNYIKLKARKLQIRC